MKIKEVLKEVLGAISWGVLITATIFLLPILGNEIVQMIWISTNGSGWPLTLIFWIAIVGIPGLLIGWKCCGSRIDFFDKLGLFIFSFIVLSILFHTLDFYKPIRFANSEKISDSFSPQISTLADILNSKTIDKKQFESIKVDPAQYDRVAKLLGCSEWDLEIRLDPKNWTTKEILNFRGD